MKAAVVHGPETAPIYEDFDDPIVADGFQLVDLVATGIHPVVRAVATGRHYGSTGVYPLIPGVDTVARTADGTLIYTGYTAAPYGTLAERMAVPGAMRLALPDGADPVQVAGGLNPGLSSWMPLTSRTAELGDSGLGTVLILGVTGMAGTLAAQNAAALGATHVIGVGRNARGLDDAAARGVHPVAVTGHRDADAAAITEALGDTAPSIVLDFVWGAPAEATFAALGRNGLDEDTADISYVEIGSLAGADAAVPASLLRSRRIRISGSGAGSGSVADIMAQVPVYMRMIADGVVSVPTRTFPLSRITDAWGAAAGSGARVVVVPD